MRVFRSARWLLLALLLPLIPVSQAHAGVFISVNFAPPVLPVYEQPPCPEPGLLWSPGYWAYDYDNGGYYWVPGAWVPAPYEGALWTPPYWGWGEGVYIFHPGYWGRHVGYYGGVNYGFGYMGVGFVGGEWREHRFAYNTAVVRVNETVIHNTYINRTIVEQHTVVNNNHIAYSGGPRGIHHDPSPEERAAMREPHRPPTQFQQQHIQTARTDRSNFFNANHGHPQRLALARPLAPAHYQPPTAEAGGRGNVAGRPGNVNGNAGVNARPGNVSGGSGAVNARPGTAPNGNPNRGEYRTAPSNQPNGRPEGRPVLPQNQRPETRPAPQPQARPQARPEYRTAPQPQPRPESRPQPEYRPAPQPQARPEARPEYRTTPQPQPRPESRPQPEYRPAPQPRPESRPQPEYRPAPQSRPQARPEQQPRQESRPAARPEQKPREPRR
jgi:hypothetical protein